MKFKEITVPYACIMASLVLWLLSINQIPVFDYTADSFWYVKNLPIFYWIGLGLILFTVFWCMNTKETGKTKFELALIFLFVLYLFGTLCFATSNPYFLDIYSHTSEVKIIGELGNISTPVATLHLDTPGSYIFFAIFSSIVGHDFFDAYVVRYYPIFVITILSIIVYATARHFSVSEKALIAPITFISFAWFLEFHISRQSFSLILFSILLLCIPAFLKSRKIQWALIFIITNVSLVICHPGAPIFFSISLASALLLMNLPWFKSKISRPRKDFKILLLLGLVVYLCWSIYFTKALPWFIDNTLFLKSAFENLLSRKPMLTPELIQNPSYEFGVVLLTREILLLLEIAIGMSSVVFLWVNKVKDKTLFLGGLMAGYLSIQVLLFFGHALLERLFLYALFPISILCALSFEICMKKRKRSAFPWFLAVILVTSMIVIPISGYGANLPFECPSSSEISLASFVKASLPNDARLSGLGLHTGLIEEATYSGSLTFYPWIGPEATSPLAEKCDLMIVNFMYNFYTLRFGTSREYKKLENETLTSYDKVYDSGLGRLYKSIENP